MIAEVQQDLPLTTRQAEILQFVESIISSRGYGPTVREIGAHFGIRSPNGVLCHLKALEKKGRIVRGSRIPWGVRISSNRLRSEARTLLQRLKSDGDTLTPETIAQVVQFVSRAGEIA